MQQISTSQNTSFKETMIYVYKNIGMYRKPSLHMSLLLYIVYGVKLIPGLLWFKAWSQIETYKYSYNGHNHYISKTLYV